MSDDELIFAGIAEQARRVRIGEVGARELVEATLRRIEALDPRLNAFRVVLGERTLSEADHAEARRREGDGGPLLGVPIAVKDDIDLAGVPTAGGTRAHGGPADRDAELVARLRAGGAVMIGKTNVPELTQWPFTESMTYGITRNPWDPERTPGGSSGGSAAAVAAGMVGAAIGSDGGGSIRIPAWPAPRRAARRSSVGGVHPAVARRPARGRAAVGRPSSADRLEMGAAGGRLSPAAPRSARRIRGPRG